MEPLSRTEYWSNGLPEGLELEQYDITSESEVMNSFCEGYLWKQLCKVNNDLAKNISSAQECFILHGDIEDQSDLNYFRDVIGLLTYFANHGGVSIYDPQMFTWWDIKIWKEKVFIDHEAYPRHHTIILSSLENDGLWLHTRGMRKFGRPDLNITGVKNEYQEVTIEMLNRFIEFQAFGGIIEEGMEVNIKDFPSGYTCHHGGDFDDPDFNNVHVEIIQLER